MIFINIAVNIELYLVFLLNYVEFSPRYPRIRILRGFAEIEA